MRIPRRIFAQTRQSTRLTRPSAQRYCPAALFTTQQFRLCSQTSQSVLAPVAQALGFEADTSPWMPSSESAEQRDPNIYNDLPITCPGCGALSQEVDSEIAGFFTRSRKGLKEFFKQARRREKEDEPTTSSHVSLPYCDRCHYLQHQSRGVPIAHPTINSIADTVAESPHRRNHIYHVLDAADFPLSFIPSVFDRLTLARPRSQNRRSQHDFSNRPTLSFIITRSDLLAPRKEMVDSLLPALQSILRHALGKRRDVRLGDVHLVSAKRGWWTQGVKEAIYTRGGASWMVGKFNVGKSNLFEVLYPKGHNDPEPVYTQLENEQSLTSLLPPPQPSTKFPTLPLVSSLPGTTASPIRLPFGPAKSPKGELIDLPGLERPSLSEFVMPEHQHLLVMESRPTVTQYVLKPGQSLLLGGGLVRITPTDSELVFLVYPFVPLPAHVTATCKAIPTQRQERESGIKSILRPDVGASMQHAGTFTLGTEVTRSRAGAMIRAGMKPDQLPFRVFATDLLIEGVGWVEIACQVRRRWHENKDALSALSPAEHQAPKIDVYSPNGKCVSHRQCINAWMLIHGPTRAGQLKPRRARLPNLRPRRIVNRGSKG